MEKEIKFGKVNTRIALGNIIGAICSDRSANEVVEKLISSLLGKQKQIAFKVFCEGKDLKTAADECDITREHARQLKDKAVLLLRKRELKNVLKEFDDYVNPPEVETEPSPEHEAFFAEFPDLSVRAANVVKNIFKIFTVKDLAEQKISELRKIDVNGYRMGTKTEAELTEFLQTRGLSFKSE